MENDIFGFIKPIVDVHTMGIRSVVNLLQSCGYKTVIATKKIEQAVQDLRKPGHAGLLERWIEENGITRIGFSYRLDPKDGCDYFMGLYERLLDKRMFCNQGGRIKDISFAGLPDTCQMVQAKTGDQVLIFSGEESPIDTLKKYGVPDILIPKAISEGCAYDRIRYDFARKALASEAWKNIPVPDHYGYKECGTSHDTYEARLNYARKKNSLPIIRTHSGPYNPNRLEALKEYNAWCKNLAACRLLDVLSIGSSQLTQSNFGEDWAGKPNGGGVPINSELEYRIIRENALPMLTRTYAGTKNVPALALMHEETLNIAWHAFSFWWFNELDGRGPNTLLQNLKEHFEALRFAASTGKPVEPNVPHHFAFRGADDITYIVSGFLAAKACKKAGIQHLILQNMLNTPKQTWGTQDLAKSRAMLKLVKELEESNFRVSLQTRVGLDYFVPDTEEAKIQLAAASCLMDDIEPENEQSPQIIHIVNYCEAVRLATPEVIKESICISLHALQQYRLARKMGKMPDMRYDQDVKERANNLYHEAKDAISLLEAYIPNLYTPEGFYKVFVEGFLPVPYLVDQEGKYPQATRWQTAFKNGGISVVDEHGFIIDTRRRYARIMG